jgi:hypothetical protein
MCKVQEGLKGKIVTGCGKMSPIGDKIIHMSGKMIAMSGEIVPIGGEMIPLAGKMAAIEVRSIFTQRLQERAYVFGERKRGQSGRVLFDKILLLVYILCRYILEA